MSSEKESSRIPLARSAYLSGACAMLPVPFVDDWMIRRIRRGLIQKLWVNHGRSEIPGSLRPAYAGQSRGCLVTTALIIVSLISKIVRKIFRTILFVLGIRAAGMEMAETYLLGRTFDQWLSRRAGSEISEEDVIRFREAFDLALRGSDRQILSGAFKATARGIGKSRHLARAFRRSDSSTAPDPQQISEELPPEDREELEQGTQETLEKLDSGEVKAFLAKFDERFTQALA